MSAHIQRVAQLPNGKDFLLSVAYPKADGVGVRVLVATSSISLVAVVILLSAIAISAWNTRKSVNPHMFVRSHSCFYLVSLLVCDFLQAVGSIMSSAWAKEMVVEFGGMCKAQAVIKHISDVGPAIWSLIIALHTFWILFLGLDTGKYVFIASIIGGWSLIGTLVIAGPATLNEAKNGHFYGISGHWCWITEGYPVERITLGYMWMFLSATLCFILYGLVLLKLRGNIITNGWKLKFRKSAKKTVADGQVDKNMVAIAKQMLIYPAAYTVLFLPIACLRFADWSGHSVSWAATIFCDVIFLMSGLVNVLLFAFTRHVLPPHTVITKRLIFPWTKPEDNSDIESTAGTIIASRRRSSFTSKTLSVELDLEKATYLDHDNIPYVVTTPFNNANAQGLSMPIPTVEPLRPESIASVTTTTTFPRPAKHRPAHLNLPTPINQRQFHDVPLNTPSPRLASQSQQQPPQHSPRPLLLPNSPRALALNAVSPSPTPRGQFRLPRVEPPQPSPRPVAPLLSRPSQLRHQSNAPSDSEYSPSSPELTSPENEVRSSGLDRLSALPLPEGEDEDHRLDA